MKRKANIITPRPYLSWSQMDMFERSPEEYEQVYIYGQKRTSSAMELGKGVAEALESGNPKTVGEGYLNMFFEQEKFTEYPINVTFEGIPLMGKLDGFTPDPLRIREYKTGTKWTQAMVDKHGQLTFYQTLVFATTGKLAEIYLDWARVENTPEGRRITGEITSFKTQRTMADLLSFFPRITAAWKGIQLLTKKSQSIIV